MLVGRCVDLSFLSSSCPSVVRPVRMSLRRTDRLCPSVRHFERSPLFLLLCLFLSTFVSFLSNYFLSVILSAFPGSFKFLGFAESFLLPIGQNLRMYGWSNSCMNECMGRHSGDKARLKVSQWIHDLTDRKRNGWIAVQEWMNE